MSENPLLYKLNPPYNVNIYLLMACIKEVGVSKCKMSVFQIDIGLCFCYKVSILLNGGCFTFLFGVDVLPEWVFQTVKRVFQNVQRRFFTM